MVFGRGSPTSLCAHILLRSWLRGRSFAVSFLCLYRLHYTFTMGHDTKIFVNQPVKEFLVCRLCDGVFEKPTSVCEAGHTFCAPCVEKLVPLIDKTSCPFCRSTIRRKFCCQPLEDLIMELEVTCPESKETMNVQGDGNIKKSTLNGDAVASKKCGWKGTLAQYLNTHCNKECL